MGRKALFVFILLSLIFALYSLHIGDSVQKLFSVSVLFSLLTIWYFTGRGDFRYKFIGVAFLFMTSGAIGNLLAITANNKRMPVKFDSVIECFGDEGPKLIKQIKNNPEYDLMTENSKFKFLADVFCVKSKVLYFFLFRPPPGVMSIGDFFLGVGIWIYFFIILSLLNFPSSNNQKTNPA